jgi:predicted transcriptional regulator
MKAPDMENLCDLYFELSNEDRLEILRKLQNESMNVTGLARVQDITTQECSRHLARLSDAMLVERGPDGGYFLSQYGRLILKLISGQRFVAARRDYFNTHSLDAYPRELVARIGELEAGKTTGNAMVTFGIVENIMREAKEFLLMIHDQYLPSILPLCVIALKRGITMRSVELKAKPPGRSLDKIRPDYLSLEDEEYFIQLWHEGRIHSFFSEEVHVFLYANEVEAVIAFPLSEGGFDYLGFSSDDPEFHKYCVDLFDYYCERADPPDQERMKKADARLNQYKDRKNDG